MATIASMNVDLTANTAAFKVALDRATQQLETFGKKGDGIMAKLKESFGRGSAFFQFGKLFAGGGAIVGLNLMTKEIEHMTEKVLEIKKAWNDNKLSGADFALEIGKAIPILGHIVGSGENINELITGNKAALADANSEAERLTTLSERMADGFKRSKAAVEDLTASMRDIMLERAKIGADPMTKRVIELQQQISSEMKRRHGEAEQVIGPILNPKGADTYDALYKKIKEVKRQRDAVVVPPPNRVEYTGKMTDYQGKKYTDAIAAIKKFNEQLEILERDFRARQEAAVAPQSQAWKNMLSVAKNGAKDYAQIWIDLGLNIERDMAKRWKRLWGASSPFVAIDSMRDSAKQMAQNLRNSINTAFGSLNLKGGKALFETIFPKVGVSEDLLGAAQKAIEAAKTPMENLIEKQRELNELRMRGLIDLKTYNNGIKESFDVLGPIKIAPKTQPARSFRFTEGIPGGRGDIFDELKRETKENTKETRENNRLIRDRNRILQSAGTATSTSTSTDTTFQDLA